MQSIQVKQGQSFFDIVLEGTGDMANILSMAIENGVSLTESLNIGHEIKPIGEIKKEFTILLTGRFAPATMITDNSIVAPPGGIGYMQIGSTFKVS
jgi:hypothetical protein